MSDADDCIAEIGKLAELAASILADAHNLRDRVAELGSSQSGKRARPDDACAGTFELADERW